MTATTPDNMLNKVSTPQMAVGAQQGGLLGSVGYDFRVRKIANGFVVSVNYQEFAYPDLDNVVVKMKEMFGE